MMYGGKMKFRFSKKLYPKIALLKSAYAFTDRAYLHLDQTDEEYTIDIVLKDGAYFDYHEFENEMLDQAVRYEIFLQTKDIRQLTVARALASTVIEEYPNQNDVSEEAGLEMESILQDWFERND